MEIICRTGDELLDEMARIIISRAVNGIESSEITRITLTDTDCSASHDYDVQAKNELAILLCANTANTVTTGYTADAKNEGNVCVLRKPYSITELEHTVRRILSEKAWSSYHHSEQKMPETKKKVSKPRVRKVSFDGKTVKFGRLSAELTKKEAAVFGILFENCGKPVSRDSLSCAVWGSVNGNICDVYICHLRDKLEPLLGKGIIVNVRNEGYMLIIPG